MIRLIVLLFLFIDARIEPSFATPCVSSPTVPSYIDTVSLAETDDGYSLFLNPAGLSFAEGIAFGGGYQHSWLKSNSRYHLVQSVLSLAPTTGFTLGVGTQLGFPDTSNFTTQGFWALTFGAAFNIAKSFALGVSALKQRYYQSPDAQPFLFALGAQILPIDWFSLGLTIGQHYSSFAAPFDMGAALIVRPFGEFVSIGASIRLEPQDSQWNKPFNFYPGCTARVDFSAVSLGASFELPANQNGVRNPILAASVALDFDYFGARIMGGTTFNQANSLGGRIRISSEP